MTEQGAGGELTEIVALARRAATAYDRPDLERRLGVVARAVADDRARVLVVGEFKAGKTELVNAVLGGRALPTDAHHATTVPTVCTHAEQAGVVLVRGVESAEGSGPRTEQQTISPAALADHVTEKGNPDNRAGWSHAEATLPRPVLSGLRLVDTPGAGGLASPASVSTMAELPGADAVLVVADAGRELTAPELALIRTAAAVSPLVVVVLTRIDLHPHWRRIAEIDRGHLDKAGGERGDGGSGAGSLRAVRVLPTSASLALHAAEGEDLPADTARALLAESGIEDLRRLLTEEVADGREARRIRMAADEVLVACEQIAHRLPRRARRPRRPAPGGTDRRRARALPAPGRGAARPGRPLVADPQRRRRRPRLRHRVRPARPPPQRDHRRRGRAGGHRPREDVGAVRALAAPAGLAGVSTNVVWAEERTRWLAERVATHFAEDGAGVLAPVTVGSSPDGTAYAVDPVGMLAAPDHEKFGFTQSLMIGMRGSYGGVLMIGMMTTIAGMALLNPFSVGAGLLLGSKTLVDERKRALRRRQGEAKQAVRRHVDDVIFQAGKNSRDMLREVQRTLRDHFTTTAEELERSLSATAEAARRVEADGAKRAARLADVEAELERVDVLAERARRLRSRASSGSSRGGSRPSRLVGA